MVKLRDILTVVLTALLIIVFLLWSILKPADSESVSERRKLAEFPDINFESLISGSFMTDFEKYTKDQFPLREQLRTVKAVTAFYIMGQKVNNGIYIEDGYLSELDYPYSKEAIEYASSRFQFVYDRYMSDKDMKVYLSIIPDKNYFMAEKNGYPFIDYEKLISDMRENMVFADYIDITEFLELSDYYRTDIHWRQEKITDAAQYIADCMGVTLRTGYNTNQVQAPFYGVYYGWSALPLTPDELYYLDNEILKSCSVYDFETGKNIPVYDEEKLQGNDLYEVFLSGSKSLLTIENPYADTDKELIIFRDSFGSSIAPLLVDGYAKITLIDIRYISPGILDRFIEFTDQDVLFLYSTFVLNNSITLK